MSRDIVFSPVEKKEGRQSNNTLIKETTKQTVDWGEAVVKMVVGPEGNHHPRTICHRLRRKDLKINCKRIQRLMRLMGIEAVYPGERRYTKQGQRNCQSVEFA